jgi:hypothetical protein
MKNPWDVVSGFKHDNRLKCHRGIVSQWTFQVGLNVTVDETWVERNVKAPFNREKKQNILNLIPFNRQSNNCLYFLN